MTNIKSYGSTVYSDIPVLETANLYLRPHHMTDLEPMSAMWNNPETTRFIGNQTRSRQDIWKQIHRTIGGWALLGYGYWAIEHKITGSFVGEAGFMEGLRDITPSFTGTPEAGWVLAPEHWNKGYASEALSAMHVWSDANLPDGRTVCIIEPAHAASIHLAEKFGYVAIYDTMIGEDPIRVFERLA